MMNERRWRKAIEQTFVVRFPKQSLATFGSTNIKYYVVTEPAFQEDLPERSEGVVRTGKVLAERPTIVIPSYMSNLEGFSSDAYEFFHDLARRAGPNSPGIMYQYKNKQRTRGSSGGFQRTSRTASAKTSTTARTNSPSSWSAWTSCGMLRS